MGVCYIKHYAVVVLDSADYMRSTKLFLVHQIMVQSNHDYCNYIT